MGFWDNSHISRGWPGHQHIEAECPCPTEPCGYVAYARIVPECEEHPTSRFKTVRASHPARSCPGR